MLRVFVCLCVGLVVGCAAKSPVRDDAMVMNLDAAKQQLRVIRERGVVLPRPVVVLSGFGDPGIASSWWQRQLRDISPGTPVVAVAFAFETSFDACRARLLRAVDAALPSDDPAWTRQVDVVAFSMGGLVARYTAAPARDSQSPQRRLRIARLFTISSPHQGADMARLPVPGSLVRDMRTGSDFLAHLDAALPHRPYELVCYARRGDAMVGSDNTAPPGWPLLIVDAPAFELPHGQAFRDPRIVLNILHRLESSPKPRHLRPPADPAPEKSS